MSPFKSILLIRHAKAEQDVFKEDIKRDLAKKGIADCELMGKRLASEKIVPDVVFISPSNRTIQTSELVSNLAGWDKGRIQIMNELYLAPLQTLISVIKRTPENVNSIAIIGHNEGITELFNSLSRNYIDNLPTCGTAYFEFNENQWSKCVNDNGFLKFYSSPKV